MVSPGLRRLATRETGHSFSPDSRGGSIIADKTLAIVAAVPHSEKGYGKNMPPCRASTLILLGVLLLSPPKDHPA
jgi:hypothetical protein